MSAPAPAAGGDRFAQGGRALTAVPEQVAWFVPGRIEVLGKHTDYAGGRSLLAAVDRGHTVEASARDDGLLRVTSAIARETVEIRLDGEDAEQRAPGHWSGYVRTVAGRLHANFPEQIRGADIAIESDLPLAAGMSSSSALVVGLSMVLLDLGGVTLDPAFAAEVPDRERLGEYLGTVENGQSYGRLAGHRGVGTFGGSEDHTAMLCAEAARLKQYAFCPVRFEDEVAFPEDVAIVVAVSGVQAEKTGAAKDRYNRVSMSAREILGRWNGATHRDDATLGEAVDSGPGASARLRTLVAGDDYLQGRLAQFLVESELVVPMALKALRAGDLREFGRIVDLSQYHAEKGLGNQTPETVRLCTLARMRGAHAASAFGAGFGGSVWAMVDREGADDFAREWVDAYAEEFPAVGDAATWLVTRPGAAAHRI